MQECERKISELSQKISKYEDMLEQILDETDKIIVQVSAGPFKREGKVFYRGNVGGGSMLLTYTEGASFLEKNVKPEIGDEVIVINGNIISVVPSELVSKKEAVKFKLIGWNQIGGLKSQLKEIRDAIELPLKHKKMYEEYGMTPLKGILLYGPPGCGKTIIGKAIASTVFDSEEVEAEAFNYIKGAEILSPMVGVAEQTISNMFKGARDYFSRTGKRAVVFIDEAEAILPRRGSRRSSDVDATIVPTFLSEMDGLEDGNPLIILSTNLPDNLDDAVIRDGRIDIKLEIKRPTQEDAIDIFEIHLGKTNCSEKLIKTLATEAALSLFNTDHKRNVSGAMIETLVKKATQKTIRRSIDSKKKQDVSIEDLKSVIETV